MNNTIADLLPLQDYYYLLHDGTKYARHGTVEANGVVVFTSIEKAQRFCETVGSGMPAFRPMRLTAVDFFELLVNVGSFCVADGLEVTVGSLRLEACENEGKE